ncbi:MAG TPA: ATP-binding protein, partial [Verrucomicrobiae bacterium]|nr:ATP-binding protein [Verrucomicrobiae bacterium]
MADAARIQAENPEQAFRQYEQGVRIRNYRIVCVLGIIFMPAGVVLDLAVYPERWKHFLGLRLVCSALFAFIWWFVRTPLGLRTLWLMGFVVGALPSFFISLMIYETAGARSPYYAGINLILLGAVLVLRWSLWNSIVVILSAIGMYLAACFLHGDVHGDDSRIFFNNLYFLFVTGVIAVTGNLFYNRIRLREFILRYELDKSRGMLAESNEKLKELDQIKNRFFANISHELRTPLTLLLSPLETMMHGGKQQFDGATRNLMSIMHGNGMRLLKLINDLLDLVRLESGRMEVKREPVEMNAFVKNLMSAAQQMADSKGLMLETTVQPDLGPLMVDTNKLEKTILNLVFNALKFTPKGGTVSLHVQKYGEQLVIEVEDTGVGISEKNLPHVFDRFWQADNSSKRKYQGVGIGLSLVKELTEVQGGSVSVQSQEGRGTTFTVNLPFIKAEGTVLPDKAEEKPQAQSAEPAPAAEAAPVPVQSEEWLTNLYRRAELFPAIGTNSDAPQATKVSDNGKGQSR